MHLPTAGTTNHTPFPPPTALGISWKDNRCTYLLQAQQTTPPWPAANCSWHQLKGHRCTYLLQAQQTTPPYSLPPSTALDISWKDNRCTYLLHAQQTTPPSCLQLLLASAERTTGAPTYCRHNKPHPLDPPSTALGISWKDTGAPTYCRHNRPHLHIPSHHQLLLTSAERTTGAPTYCRHNKPHPLPASNCSWHQLKGQQVHLPIAGTTNHTLLARLQLLLASAERTQVHLPTAGTTDHTSIFPFTVNCSWHQLKGQQVHLPTAGTTNHTPFPPPTALGISWKDNRCTYLLQAQQTTPPWPASNCSWHQLKGHRCTYLLQAQQTTPPYSLSPSTALGISWKDNRYTYLLQAQQTTPPYFLPPPTALDISWKDNRCTYLLQAQQTTPHSRLQLLLASAERTTGAPTYCRHNKPHPLGPPPTALGISWKDTGAPTYCRHNRPHLHIPFHRQLLLASAERTTGTPIYCRHNRPHLHIPSHHQLLLTSAERTTGAPTYCRHNKPHPIPASNCSWHQLKGQQVHLPTAGTTNHTPLARLQLLLASAERTQVHLPTAGTTDHTSIFPPTTNCSWHQLKGQQVHLPTAGTTNHTLFPPPTALGISWKDNRCTYLLQAQQTTPPWPASNCSWHQLEGHRCTYLLQAQQTTPSFPFPPPTNCSWHNLIATSCRHNRPLPPISNFSRHQMKEQQMHLVILLHHTTATECLYNQPNPY